MKRFLCWLLGHEPSAAAEPLKPGGMGNQRYTCRRCHRAIYPMVDDWHLL